MSAAAPVAISLKGQLVDFRTLDWYRQAAAKIRRHRDFEIDLAEVTSLSDLHLYHLYQLIQNVQSRGGEVFLVNDYSGIAARIEKIIALEKDSVAVTKDLSVITWFGETTIKFFSRLSSFFNHGLYLLSNAIDGIFYPSRRAPGSVAFQMINIGINAVPIVSLLIFLVGIVLTLLSAEQLRQFGANYLVVDLVVVAMSSEMGPLITAIIISGRSGASIAAEIATMQVNEEIDALQTMSIDPFAYVITPKLFGILLTIPLLTITADIIGILGGMLIANLSLDLSFLTFFQRALQVADVWNFTNGLIKSVIFGWLIVYIASWYGLQAKRGAEGVGRVTTHSVVTSIFMIIVADSLLSLIFYL
jgi:phospholipid/cholesterol/gamma-HCH transport system permease protein